MPDLSIIYSPKDVKLIKRDLPNTKYIETRLSDKDLIELMNQCGIHICTSETEGFGHYINEAKSCQSIVISIDSKPMNELVNDNTALLEFHKKIKSNYGKKYF